MIALSVITGLIHTSTFVFFLFQGYLSSLHLKAFTYINLDKAVVGKCLFFSIFS